MEPEKWVGDFIDYLRNERAYSERTISSYSLTLRDLARYAIGKDEGQSWDILDDGLVRAWVADMMEAGMNPRTVKKMLSAVRTFYRYLKLTGRVERNPMTRVVSPKTDKPLPKFFRDDDINRLLDRLRAKMQDGAQPDPELDTITHGNPYEEARAYLIILLLYMTGMRRGEMYGLDTGDIDLRQMQLKVTGKRNKQRVIPIGREVADAVVHYLPIREEMQRQLVAKGREDTEGVSGALFLGMRGKRMSTAVIEALAVQLTGLVTTQAKRSPHVFRHTFATSMLNRGGDLQSIKELLGHESLATTEVYTHTNFEELRRAYIGAHPRG